MLSKTKILAALAILLATPAFAQDAAMKVDLLGSITLPTGLIIAGEEFGGISGLDYDARSGLFYAISDDRSQRAPARYYEIGLKIDAKGLSAVDVIRRVTLRDLEGNAFPFNGIDPESIRFNPATRTILWSSEGDVSGRPGIYEARLDGTMLRSFAVPDYYFPNADKTTGVYSNLAFEALTLSADGKALYAATENALAQDGAKATLEAGSPSRVIALDLASGQPTAEYIYETNPIAIAPTATTGDIFNDNGVSEFLTLDDGRFLVVERSFASGVGNQINFFAASLDGATDINGQEKAAADAVAITKEPAFTLAEGDFGLDIDNIESLTFGPEVDGKKTLVIASDNNFNANGQFTQFVVLTIAE